MGLFDLIPPDNQLGQILMGMKQPLNDLGVGLQRGKTWQKGIREASKYTEEQAPLRAEQAQLQMKSQNEANARNRSAGWLRTQPGGEQFAAAIENGTVDGSTGYKAYLDSLKGDGAGGAGKVGLNPGYARDAKGNIVPVQYSDQGTAVQTSLPDGLTLLSPMELAGGKRGSVVDAETAAKARASLRPAKVSKENTRKAIAELRLNQNGMDEWFGQVGPRGVYISPGSEMGKFWAAAEPTNNQAFMQAREALKGGGQITDFEGQKAEDAFSRMRASLATGDQQQYLRALSDFEAAVAEGYRLLEEAASPSYSQGGGGANDPLGLR
tara:strand:+ start:9576 stop:10547 length:972 start_codon:yes stop_codon:yes gene_type:complete